MKRLSGFAARSPVLFSLAVALAFVVIVVVAGVAAYPAGTEAGTALASGAVMLVGVLGLLVVLNGLGWSTSAGVTRVGTRRAWLLMIPLVVYLSVAHVLAFFGTDGVRVPDAGLAAALVFENLVDGGLLQELTFRALVLHALVRAWGSTWRGVVGALGVSAALFSAVHAVNLVAGAAASTTALQLIDTLLAGFYLGVIVLFTQSIWPAVVLHATGNILTTVLAAGATDFTETTGSWAALLLLKAPLYVVAVYLFRHLAVPTTARRDGAAPATSGRGGREPSLGQ